MRIILLIFLIAITIAGFGQNAATRPKKFSIGVNFSPNYSNYIYKADEEVQFIVEEVKEHKKPGFDFNTGISFVYVVYKRIEFETGVQFSRQSLWLKNVIIVDNDLDSLGKSNGALHHYCLGMPLKINYHILDRKLSIYGTGGISLNLYLDSRTVMHLEYNDGRHEKQVSQEQIDQVNHITIALIAGLGFDYDLGNRFTLRFEPLFRYSLQPLADAPIKWFNYSIGGQFGVLMKL
jgi:nitrogen regulatory protein PII